MKNTFLASNLFQYVEYIKQYYGQDKVVINNVDEFLTRSNNLNVWWEEHNADLDDDFFDFLMGIEKNPKVSGREGIVLTMATKNSFSNLTFLGIRDIIGIYPLNNGDFLFPQEEFVLGIDVRSIMPLEFFILLFKDPVEGDDFDLTALREFQFDVLLKNGFVSLATLNDHLTMRQVPLTVTYPNFKIISNEQDDNDPDYEYDNVMIVPEINVTLKDIRTNTILAQSPLVTRYINTKLLMGSNLHFSDYLSKVHDSVWNIFGFRTIH